MFVKRHKGLGSVAAIFTVSVLALILNTAIQSAEYIDKRRKGSAISEDIVVIISHWEQLMNYYCSVDAPPVSLDLSDLSLPPGHSSKTYNSFSFSYDSPPNASITLKITGSSVTINKALNMLEVSLVKMGIKAQVVASISDNELEVEANRISLTSQSVFDLNRRNTDASVDSIMIDGMELYDSNGCN